MHLRPIGRRREQRHDAPRPLEREVRRLAERPVAPVPAGEPLLGAQAVDRQLQRARPVRRPAELVVDQPERAVLEQVDPIGLAAQRHRARPVGGREREVARRADARAGARRRRSGARPPCAARPRRGRRRRTTRAAASARAPLRRPAAARASDRRRRRTSRAPSSMFAGVMARRPAACHSAKNASNTSWTNWPCAPRVHHLFVVGLFFEPEDVLREELERAVEIRLERAHRPRPRRLRARDAVEVRPRRPARATGAASTHARGAGGRPRRGRPARATALRRRTRARPRHRRPRATVDSRARGTSSSCDDGDTSDSSSSVNVESVTRRAADASRSRKRASAAPWRSFSEGQPSDFEQRRRIEDVAPRTLGPVAFDQPDDRRRRRSRRSGRPDRRAGARRCPALRGDEGLRFDRRRARRPPAPRCATAGS